MEATPSANSWSQVEKKIKPNRKPGYYWVAATVTLIAITWVLIPSTRNFEQALSGVQITHPPIEVEKDLEIPVAVTLPVENEEPKTPLLQKKNKVQVASIATATLPVKKINEKLTELKLDSKSTTIAEVVETPAIEEPLIVPVEETQELITSPVKITYIASNNKGAVKEAENAPDSTSKFKKFIAFAEKIDPGEMLADMKTAKDNLLNSGFKSKKDKSVMNP